MTKSTKIEEIMEEYEIEDTRHLNKELNLLRILKEHPTYSIADLYNMAENYIDGKIDKEFAFEEVKFLCKNYFKLGW